MRGKKRPCLVVMNAHLTGHIFAPIECKSITEAKKIGNESGFPYRIFDISTGVQLYSGWDPSNL